MTPASPVETRSAFAPTRAPTVGLCVAVASLFTTDTPTAALTVEAVALVVPSNAAWAWMLPGPLLTSAYPPISATTLPSCSAVAVAAPPPPRSAKLRNFGSAVTLDVSFASTATPAAAVVSTSVRLPELPAAGAAGPIRAEAEPESTAWASIRLTLRTKLNPVESIVTAALWVAVASMSTDAASTSEPLPIQARVSESTVEVASRLLKLTPPAMLIELMSGVAVEVPVALMTRLPVTLTVASSPTNASVSLAAVAVVFPSCTPTNRAMPRKLISLFASVVDVAIASSDPAVTEALLSTNARVRERPTR